MKKKQKTNLVLTIVLILGTLTVFFPLYMAVIIAFKKPSEMTNDVAGALSFPKQWSFENFRQAMEVTDFWRSLGNSLLITLVTIVLAILIHSIAGYVIGRGRLVEMARSTDDLIEAVYLPGKTFVWGVQWHPEMSLRVDEASRKIFEAFVEATNRRMN